MAGQSHKAETIELDPITTFAGGKRSQTQIIPGLRTFKWIITIVGLVTLAGGPATQILNRGKLRAIGQYAGLTEGGDDVLKPDTRDLGRMSDLLGASPSPNHDLQLLANGAYQLRDQFTLYCAWPTSLNPQETCFREKNSSINSYIFMDMDPLLGKVSPYNVNGLLCVTAGTALLSNLEIFVEQVSDDQIGILSYYRPRYRTFTQMPNPSATYQNQRWNWDQVNNPVRALVLAQDSNVGLVPDSISGVRLLTSRAGYLYGRTGSIPWSNLIDYLSQQFGGAVDWADVSRAVIAASPHAISVDGCQWVVDFASHGKLSQILRPDLVGNQIWWALDGNPSGVTGVTSLTQRTTLFELQDARSDPGLGPILNPTKPWDMVRA